MRLKDIPGIDQLSTSEKLALLEELWDNIAVDESDIPVPDSHIEELNRRLEKYRVDMNPGLSADEVMKRLRRDLNNP